jgi:PDZ domain-containing secreted protein
MKKLVFLLPLALVAGVAAAQTQKPATHQAQTKQHAMKTHELAAEVVSADVKDSKLTVKIGMDEKTVPVEGKAVASLKNVKPGEKVTLTCRDNEAGEHQAITAIEPAKTPKK